ncbi:MAG: hypothetical protein IJ684_00875 [Bacteroidales bacterium]|nr:hypothetical protein [Bacteroidales bacterium]
MPFLKRILEYPSLSIVGLEKNTGKTVCLNYVLRRLDEMGVSCAVTSIGVDGEQTDSVYGSAKPEVTLYEGTTFITSERHYRLRQAVTEIVAVDERRTSLGRLVTGRVRVAGKMLLSGAASTEMLRRQIADFRQRGVRLTIVDGALSRLSLASPTVTDAMVLATGAAVSPNLMQLVSRTRFVHRLISLPEVDAPVREALAEAGSGLWAVDDEGKAHDLHVASVFLLDRNKENLFRFGHTLYASGAVSDRLLKSLTAHPEVDRVTLVVRDFTKLFLTPEVFGAYVACGGRLQVLQQSKLVAVCLNPTSPQGYTLRSEEACAALQEALGIPVYDVMKIPCR